MDKNKCIEIAKFEFGSKYQKTDDHLSDSDVMEVVVQPLVDSIFQPLDKGVVHYKHEINGDDVRVYSLEKFLLLALKGSYDGFISLTAFMNSDSKYKDLFEELFDDNVFTDLVRSKMAYYVVSCFGVTYNALKKLNNNPSGKDYLKFVLMLNRLEFVKELLDNPDLKVSYKDFIFYKTHLKTDVELFKKFKRLESNSEEMVEFKNKYSDLLDEYYMLFEKLRADVNHFNNSEYKYQAKFDYDYLYKEKVTRYLVKYYLNLDEVTF